MRKREMIFGVLAVLVGVLVGLAIPAWAEEQVISDVPAGNYGDLKLTHRNSMDKVERQIRETGLTPYFTKERMLVETQSLTGKWYTGWIPAGTLLLCEVSQNQDGTTIYVPKIIAICGNKVNGVKIAVSASTPPPRAEVPPPQPQQPPRKKVVVVEQPQPEEDEEVIVVQQPPPKKRVIYVYVQAPADYSENYSRQMYTDNSGYYNSGYGTYGFGIPLPPPPPFFGGHPDGRNRYYEGDYRTYGRRDYRGYDRRDYRGYDRRDYRGYDRRDYREHGRRDYGYRKNYHQRSCPGPTPRKVCPPGQPARR